MIANLIKHDKEINAQKIDSEKQKELLTLQQFSSTFFQLQNIFQSNITILQYKKYNGANAIKKYKEELEFLFNNKKVITAFGYSYDEPLKSSSLPDTKTKYASFISGNDLTFLFRCYYNLINFIQESSINKEQKNQYISIIRNLTSNDFLALFLYNCTLGSGSFDTAMANESLQLLKNWDFLLNGFESDIIFHIPNPAKKEIQRMLNCKK